MASGDRRQSPTYGDDDLPEFSGDVADDLQRTRRVAGDRFNQVLARGWLAFGVAVFLAGGAIGGLTGLVELVLPDGYLQRPTVLVVVLCALAVAGGVTGLVRAVPGRARLVVGVLFPAGVVTAGTFASQAGYASVTAVLLSLAGFVAIISYVIVAGVQLRRHANRQLADAAPAKTGGRDDEPARSVRRPADSN